MKAVRRRRPGVSIKSILIGHRRELDRIIHNAITAAIALAVPNQMTQQARSEREVICREASSVLLAYGAHLKGCPWRNTRTKGKCACGFHLALAKLLPQERRCDKCRHPIGFHISRGQDTYCIAPLMGRTCRCKKYPIATR